MKIFDFFNVLCVELFYCSIIESTISSIYLHEIVKTDEFYQISLFLSRNFTKSLNLKMLPFQELPNKIYAFDQNLKQIHDNSSENSRLANMYSLQESLIIFYTSDLKEIKWFISFSVSQLSVRKNPNCLIMYSSDNFTNYDEIDLIEGLMYAIKKKFFDFTVIVLEYGNTPLDGTSMFMYQCNPFDDVFYRKILPSVGVEIFPDKLKNAHKHPIYTTSPQLPCKTTQLRDSKGKLTIEIEDFFFIDYTAKILNLTTGIRGDFRSIVSPDYLEKFNLDIFGNVIASNVSYKTNFLIPAYGDSEKYVAFVPVIAVSQNSFVSEIFFNIFVIFGIFSTFFIVLRYFRTGLGSIGGFDLVRLFLNQSIAHKPLRAVHRIILLTITVASVKFTNDFLLDIFLVHFENNEVPFKTYEDLYNSKLKTFSPYSRLKDLIVTDDPFLSKILNQTLGGYVRECLEALKNWKNVSCIFIPTIPEYIISLFRDSDGSPTMKVAEPPIFVRSSGFYWFSDNSPYAMKFLQIMRRIKETDLMHWPALLDEDPGIVNIEGTNKVTIDDGMKPQHLLSILSFCFAVSSIAFGIEFIIFKIGKVKEDIKGSNIVFT